MNLKNFFKTAIFAGTLAVGCAAAINFAPKAEAAYVSRTVTSNGNSDYGFYMGKACNIKDYYKNYVSTTNYDTINIYGDQYYKNGYFGNYAVTKNSPMNIKIYGDDPVVAFVEKEYLRTEGDFVLFGNEYGYYVHTKKNNNLYYTSDIVIIDYDYSQPKDNPTNTSTYYNIPIYATIVCQYQVLTINRSRLKELSWANQSQMPLDIVVDNEDFSDIMQMHYEFDKCTWPGDGYVSVPVLKKDWATNPTTGVAFMDHLYLSNFYISSKLSSKIKDFSITGDGRSMELSEINMDKQSDNDELKKMFEETLIKQLIRDGSNAYAFGRGLNIDDVTDWNPWVGLLVKAVTHSVEYGKILYSYYNSINKLDQSIDFIEFTLSDPDINNVSYFDYYVDKLVNSSKSNDYTKMYAISRHGIYKYKKTSGQEVYKDIEDYIRFGFKFESADLANKILNHFTLNWIPYYKSKDGFIRVADNIKFVNIDCMSNVSGLDNEMIFTNDYSNLEYDYYGDDNLKSLDDLKTYAGGANYKFIDVAATRAKAFEFDAEKTGTYNFTLSANNIMTIKVWEKNTGKLVYYGNWNNYPSFDLCLDPKTYIMEIIVWESSDKSQNSKFVKIFSINKTINVSNDGC